MSLFAHVAQIIPRRIPVELQAAMVRYDDFERASMGPNWSLLPDWPADDAELQIVNGRCQSVAGNSRGDMWRNDFPGPLGDQFAEVDIANWTGTTNRLGSVLLREDPNADSCYEFSVIHDPSFDAAVIAKMSDGQYYELHAEDYVAQVGDRIRAEVIGTNPPHLIHRINDEIIWEMDDDNPQSWGPPLTTGYPGIATIVLGGGDNSNCQLDNWVGGEIVYLRDKEGFYVLDSSDNQIIVRF